MFPAISAAVLQCCSVSAVRAGNYRIITAVSNSVSRSSHFPTTTATTGDRGVLHGTERSGEGTVIRDNRDGHLLCDFEMYVKKGCIML